MKGILFTPENLKAIVEGRKTQTRRLIKPQPEYDLRALGHSYKWVDDNEVRIFKPKYIPGETVYIKEAYKIIDVDPQEKDYLPTHIEYGDGIKVWVNRPLTIPVIMPDKLFSPLVMPSWAARYFIKILDVRPERLQEITYQDARAEGILVFDTYVRGAPGLPMRYESTAAYMDLWDSINKDYPWSSNPWVWRYEFKLVEVQS